MLFPAFSPTTLDLLNATAPVAPVDHWTRDDRGLKVGGKRVPAFVEDPLTIFAEDNELPVDGVFRKLEALLAGHPTVESYGRWMSIVDLVKRQFIPGVPQPDPLTPITPRGLDLFNPDGTANRPAFVRAITAERPFVALRDSDELLVYHGGIYSDVAPSFVRGWAEGRFREVGSTSSASFRREVIDSIRVGVFVDREDLNPAGFLAVDNGLLDLRGPTGPVFKPHDPLVRLTFKLPVSFDPAARCPSFLKLLEEAQPEPGVRDLLQEEFGYCLTLGNPYKTAFFWVGLPDTGKSTLHAILRGVLGPRNVSAVSLQSLGESRFAGASLFGKLANLHSDLSSRIVRDTATFKMLVGGTDMVSAERKFQHAFAFVNGAKLFFSANEMPPVPAADEAFFRRWTITLFRQRIPIERQDPGLADRLVREEGSGILNWALEGLARLTARNGFNPPASVAETGRTWRQLSDSLSWFVDEMTTRDPNGRETTDAVFEAYQVFCEERGADHVKTRGQLSNQLPALIRGATIRVDKPGGKGAKSVRTWHGFRLRQNQEYPPETVEPVEPGAAGLGRFYGSTGSTPFEGDSSKSDDPQKVVVVSRATGLEIGPPWITENPTIAETPPGQGSPPVRGERTPGGA